MEKVEQGRYISSHDIGKDLNIDYKTILNHLEKVGYKKTQCLGATLTLKAHMGYQKTPVLFLKQHTT